MAFALIADAGNTWDGTALDAVPDPIPDGCRVIVIPANWPADCYWSPEASGWVDIVSSAVLTVGRFMLLFTQAERIALRAAATSSAEVADYLDLLRGFTDGVSLADPMTITAIGELQSAGLLTAARSAAILAGTPPPTL